MAWGWVDHLNTIRMQSALDRRLAERTITETSDLIGLWQISRTLTMGITLVIFKVFRHRGSCVTELVN